MTKNRILVFVFALSFMLRLFGAWADSGSQIAPKRWSFVTLGLTPVQSGGRIKPLDSFAREVVLFETGSRSFENWDSIDLLLSWISFPQDWGKKSLIQVAREDVRRQLGLDEHRRWYSPQELFKNSALLQYAEQHTGKGRAMPEVSGGSKVSPREQELKAVIERINLFHALVTGHGWPLIPKPSPTAWASLADGDREGEMIRNQFFQVLKSYEAQDESRFERASLLFKSIVLGELPHNREILKNQIWAELIYHKSRPFFWAWVFYLGAGLMWILCQILSRPRAIQKVKKLAFLLTGLALGSHILGIALRCFIAGRPPVTNMYESVMWVSLGVMIFAAILYWLHRQTVILTVASILAMLGLIAGDAAPAILDPSLHPLVPVLRSNYWLTVHVLTITMGYAAFALTLGLANITLFQFLKGKKKEKIAGLNQLTYRAMQFGVILIAAGTILGGIWADYSWGRFWGWDPKEVWALVTLLCYLVILHGRYANWVGSFGFAAWSAMSFLSVVMAWYGVNFILGAGLHSYGFATGGTPWVLGFVLLQVLYVLGVTWVHHRGRQWSRLFPYGS